MWRRVGRHRYILCNLRFDAVWTSLAFWSTAHCSSSMSGQASDQGQRVDAMPSDSVVLVSSDGKRVPFPRLLLAATSKVFRDMFELASDGPASKQECGVSETSTELAAFASALDGKTSHYENTWLSLQRMMDKYDVPMLRTVLLLSARSVTPLCDAKVLVVADGR